MRSPDRDRDPSKLEWLCQLVGYEKEHILPTLFRAMLDLVSSQSFLRFWNIFHRLKCSPHTQIPECLKQWDDDQLRARFKVIIGDDIKAVAESILAITEAAKPQDDTDEEVDILCQNNYDESVEGQDSFIRTGGENQTQDSGFQESLAQMNNNDGPSRRDSSSASTSTSTSTTRRASKRLQEEFLNLDTTNEETENRPRPEVKRRRTTP